MKPRLLAALLALSFAPAAFAQAAAPQKGEPAAWQQRHEQHLAQRADRLAQKLGLDATAAARFKASFEDFAQKRKALGEKLKAANQTLRAAAQGDSTAGTQVEGAIGQLRSLRSQMMQLEDGLFDQLSNGLNQQQKAKLVLSLERAKHGRFGHGPGRGHFGPPGQPPQQQ